MLRYIDVLEERPVKVYLASVVLNINEEIIFINNVIADILRSFFMPKVITVSICITFISDKPYRLNQPLMEELYLKSD